ncbi:uncharacterized protein LOC117334689 isoform X2 [Pecten maximus]|uniref:uncharacterized protein LOC117334689 isoform X1 n=1 Tax=Pecten maximus TaxID=6579 RepID=UPI0014584592|nr:uncharacterized protein LOC117334689 isoform X1 [Pecten maximus]XP_033750338.1 uncharacterized protein LOC117334689 isoform X2 [Pecten maximus]
MNLELFWLTLLVVGGSAQRLAPYLYRWRNMQRTPTTRAGNLNDRFVTRQPPLRNQLNTLRLHQRVASRLARQRLANSLANQRLNANLANQRLAFLDPVRGNRHSVNYRPLSRSDQIGQYYKGKTQSLTGLRMFPVRASKSFEDDSIFKNTASSENENTYANDNNFFLTLQKTRQQLAGGYSDNSKYSISVIPRENTAVRIVPKTSLWDRLITYLLNDWESQ